MVLGGGVAKYIADGRVPLEWYTGAVDDSEAGIHPVLTKGGSVLQLREDLGVVGLVSMPSC
jgi:hypothetical protein